MLKYWVNWLSSQSMDKKVYTNEKNWREQNFSNIGYNCFIYKTDINKQQILSCKISTDDTNYMCR